MSKKYHGPKVDVSVQPCGILNHYKVVFKPHNPADIPRNGSSDYIGDWLKELFPNGRYDPTQRAISVEPVQGNRVPSEVCCPFVRTVDLKKYFDSRGRYRINNNGPRFGITVIN